MQDNLFVGAEAREKLMVGVRKVAEAVGQTMGTSGKNSLLEALERPGFFSTNDGKTILDAIRLADPIEEIGRKIVSEAVSRANKKSGDGSSTTCVLTAAILEEGMKHLKEASPMEIKRSLEACIPLIEASVNSQKREVTVDTLQDVATVSAEDPAIGAMIQEIYRKIGKDGIISWDVSNTPDDSYSVGTGITVADASCVTSYMFDAGGKEAKLDNPLVMLTRKKIGSVIEFEGLYKELFEKDERQLLIFCEEIEPSAVGDFLQTQRIQGFRTVVVRMPVLWRDEWWQDLALASGAKLIDLASGINIQHATSAVLGRFGHVTVGREQTLIEGTNDLSKHLMALKVDGSDEALNRAARLNTQTARYFVGAHSESALAYRRLKVEDAINAASCALDNGIVPGGGVALLNAGESLDYRNVGGAILRKALQKPFERIVTNSGAKVSEIALKTDSDGFNSKTGKVENLMSAGIVDPTDVVLNAVRNAIGVAASILTAGTVVTLPREEWQPAETPKPPTA